MLVTHLKHETNFTIKHNNCLAENTVKSKIRQLLFKYNETMFMNRKKVKPMYYTDLFLTCHKD